MSGPKILIGCEKSGTVRDAFLARGYDAWSCDIEADVARSNRHIPDDIVHVLDMDNWDVLFVAHPPCTRLCNSGVRWLTSPPPNRTLAEMWDELREGAALFSKLWNADQTHNIPHVAVENPVMHKHAKALIKNYADFTQSVQPWQFGTDPDSWDATKKRTCLWTRGLPPLVPTGTLTADQAVDRIHKMGPSAKRAEARSRFFPGLAAAIADQWGAHAARFERGFTPT